MTAPPASEPGALRRLIGRLDVNLSAPQWIFLYLTLTLAALALFLLLHSWPVGRTAVDLIVEAELVQFRLGDQPAATAPALADEVEAVGPARVEGSAPPFAVEAPPRLRVVRPAGAPPLTLRPLDLPAGAAVTLRRLADRDGGVEIMVRPGVEAAVMSRAPAPWDAGAASADGEGQAARMFRVGPPATQTVIRARLAEDRYSLVEPVMIAGLSFTDVAGENGEPKLFSSIRAGSVRFEEVGGKERALRSRETLQFAAVSGYLRLVEIGGGTLRVEFSGEVSDMRTGLTGSTRSLMPSQLERLAADSRVTGVLALVLGLFSILTGLSSLYKKPRPS
jgi:hypothetical protein